jgi:AcrR family transcriptional regulator
MGRLIDPERTRKAREAREERASRILNAADHAFTRYRYSEITLDTIGRQAGVKQGQASLAFKSREELYMHVVRTRLEEWFKALESGLEGSDSPTTRIEFADLVASTLAERHKLTHVLGPIHTALELHEDGLEVHRYYHWLRGRLLELAAAIARRIEGVHLWNAFDALYKSHLMAAAVHPVSRPVGNLAVDLMNEDHQVFALDLEDEVQRIVLDCLRD